ncbi:MAG: hypothetical protein NT118_05220 [Lentisphaerae bacterium]|nr:hypothetical protein [Lentisphaerota bacterium]
MTKLKAAIISLGQVFDLGKLHTGIRIHFNAHEQPGDRYER